MRALFLGITFLAAAGAGRSDAADQPDVAAHIAITAPTEGEWTVAYTLPAPAAELVFVRSPDDSRGEDWTAPDGFKIVFEGGSERARRTDGQPFSEIRFGVPPRYRDLPKDYAPFMPFGDGGRLFYTGRMFACGGECPDDARWTMSIETAQEFVLVDGERHDARASWSDSGQGRNVYVGHAEPVVSDDVVALIDTALPPQIRRQLETYLPRFSAHFTQQLGALGYTPMLFASYDVSPQDGRWGRQGGTLPGQVFMHFYGQVWPSRIDDPALPDDLAWFFAHEAGHMYQHEAWADGDVNAWIHEGGAEAFAALALRAQGAGNVAEAKVASARRECTAAVAQTSVRDAIAAGKFDVAYSCGLLVSLAIDDAVKRTDRGGDGLYKVWRDFIASEPPGRHTEAGFLAAVARAGGDRLADEVRMIVRTPGPDFAKLGAAQGRSQPIPPSPCPAEAGAAECAPA